MANEFDKQLFFENIAYLLKQKGMRIGELESKAGVSTGYISRTSKDANVKPGIDFIVNAANALDVSLDALLCARFSDRSHTEEYLSSFIDKLTINTMNEELFWDVETSEYLNTLECVDPRFLPHPLFTAVEDTEDYGCFTWFDAHTISSRTKILGDCYKLDLDKNTRLYIMSAIPYKGDEVQYLLTGSPLEMWIVKMDSLEKQFLVSATPKNEKGNYISKQLRRLYTTIEEYMKMPQVKRCFRDAIDTFMNSGNDFSGNSSDSLPIE